MTAESLDPRIPIIKAYAVGSGQSLSNAMANIDDAENAWQNVGAIDPPFNPRQLVNLFEHSNALRQNVDAYAANIDGFGHRFEPLINLDLDESKEAVRTALTFAQAGSSWEQVVEATDPSDAAVEAEIKRLRRMQRLEYARLSHWFDHCGGDLSFMELRQRLRGDSEIQGNGYWEVLRDRRGRPSQFQYLPAFTVRLLPLDDEATPYTQLQRTPAMTVAKVQRRKRFRRFVQIFEQRKVFFKEYGDPRVISSSTGKVYENVAALEADEKRDNLPGTQATEVFHFRVHSSRTAYGIPRWIGNLLGVLGNRQAEEINFLYFENKSVPPLAVLVSGGRLDGDSITRLETYIDQHLKGKNNFHKVLVLEAEGTSTGQLIENSGRCKIEIQPLTDAQQKDGLFQNYDQRNIDKVGQSFRVPRLLRGDSADVNKATASAALEFAEGQVFAPIRGEFDFIINQHILPALGILHWRFKSNGPTKRDPAQLAEAIQKLQDVVPPQFALELAEEVFGRDFPKVDADWVKRPIKLTMQGVQDDGTIQLPEAPPGGGGNGMKDPARSQGELPNNKRPRKPKSKENPSGG